MAAPKKYPDELRERAVRLVLESGRPIAQIAQDLGIHRGALRKWVRQAEADQGSRRDRLTSEERERLKTLERENRELRKANEDTTDCPRRWFSRARLGCAGTSSAGGPVVGV